MTDSGPLTGLVERYGHRLKKVAFLLTGNDHDAEDLLQTALAKLFVAWQRAPDLSDPFAYARRTLVTTHISAKRRRWWSEVAVATVPDHLTQGDGTRQVDDAVVLGHALARLSPRQRAVVVLRHYEDLSEPETAAYLGCSVGTVKTLNARALAALRRHLDDDRAGRSSVGRKE